MKGIDVSTVQGKIDWQSVAADDVKFTMVKASQGRGEGVLTRKLRCFADSRFAANVTGAANAGLSVGVYHYFTATTESDAIYEAQYFLKTIAPYKNCISLWGAVDVESRYLNELSKDALTTLVNTFMTQVECQGYQPILYTNPSYLTYRLNLSELSGRDIWLAHWGVATPMSVPNMRIWQKGSDSVRGIRGLCDINEGYFDDVTQSAQTPKVGDRYIIQQGDMYANGVRVPERLIGQSYLIMQVRNEKILLGGIMSWLKRK